MIRLFRWSYLAPRLIAVFVVLCVVEFGAGWAVKQAVRSGGESAVGARVDIRRAKASLLTTRVELGGVQVADPDAPMTNLVEADTIELDFDAASLLRKKAVVTSGSVRGLRFGTGRVASGQLDPRETEPRDLASSGVADAAAAKAKAWFDSLGQRFASDLQDQFESVRVARELRARWPEKHDALTLATDQLRTEAEQLIAQVSDALRNPLRNAPLLQEMPLRVAELRRRIEQLHAELDAMPAQIEADRQAIAAAREHDEQVIRETLSVDPIDPASLSAYLLGDEIGAPVSEVIAWLRWARAMAPAGVDLGEPERGRGVDVRFGHARRSPDLLVQQLNLTGTARLAGRPFELAGALTDFTTQPRRHGEPLRLHLTASGAVPFTLKATIDRTQATPRDELLADCEGLAVPRLDLGGDRFGVAVEPTQASISVSLLVDGDQLSGDVQVIQQHVRVEPRLAAGSDAEFVAPLRRALTENLRQLPTMATRVDLGGTLDQPQLRIWSTLGPAVAQAVRSALDESIDQQTDRLLAASQREVEQQLAEFDEELLAARTRIEQALGEPAEAINRLAALLPGGSGLGRLGRLLPEGLNR